MLDKIVRYEIIDQLLGPVPDGTILEIGAGPQGLGAVLPHPFVGVDPWYPEPPIPTQRAVRASGTELPFADRSFDYVLCIEVLEHVPPDIRPLMLAEMCRVARRKVVITHPYGGFGRFADHVLNVIYSCLRIVRVPKPWWLVEHLRHPYPDPRKYLSAAGDSMAVHSYGQENAFLHVGVVFFGTLKIVARRTARLYKRRPRALKRLVHVLDFPPYCRKVVILERQSAQASR